MRLSKNVWLLVLTLIIGPLFLMVPDFTGGKYFDFFLLSDQQLTVQTWLYFACEHVVIIILCYLIAQSQTKYYKVAIVYYWIQIIDFIDYLLTYNSVWFTVEHLPVSMNTLGLCVFLYYAIMYGRVDND